MSDAAHDHYHVHDASDDLSVALPPPYVNDDGTLRIESLHDPKFHADPLPVGVAKSVATAHPLFTNGQLGADVLYMPPNQSFPLHVHPGDHLLLCLRGTGTVTVGERVFEVKPGDIYMVPGGVEHAVGAGVEGHWLVSIGAPHVPVVSEHRMVVVEQGHDYSAQYAAARAFTDQPAH